MADNEKPKFKAYSKQKEILDADKDDAVHISSRIASALTAVLMPRGGFGGMEFRA